MDGTTRSILNANLHNLTIDDLKVVVKQLKLNEVSTSGSKGTIITAICASPSLTDTDKLSRLVRIAEYFGYGGSETLTLFKVNDLPPFSDLNSFAIKFGTPGTITYTDDHPFRFDSVKEFRFHGENYFSAKFEFPGWKREVDDYNTGVLEYIPVTEANCIFRCRDNDVVLDIRCVSSRAESFAKCITGIVWGKDPAGLPLQSPVVVPLSHELTLALRTKFKARSYQVKISEADEEIRGRFHPSTTEFISKSRDLTKQRKKLGVSSGALDMAHGLEFSDKYEGIVRPAGCKIILHFVQNQIRFMKTSTFGSYDAVIKAILELSDE